MHDDNYDSDHAIPRPEGPKKRPPISRLIDPHYPETASKMGYKKSTKKNGGNRSSSSTSNSSNASESSLLTPEQNPRRCREMGGKSRLYPDLTKFKNYDTESSGSSPRKSDRTTESITDSFDSSKSDKTLDGSKHSEASFKLQRKLIVIKKVTKSSKKPNQWERSFVLIVVSIIAAILGYYGLSNLLSTKGKNEFDLKSSISNLRSLFPSQDADVWSHFGSGIAGVQSKDHTPAIFLLLASHDETTNCLAKRVAELARSALRGSGEVTLTLEKPSSINQVFELMENHLNQTKAVVLFDILRIHPEAIKAFHDICDQYTSLISEAVYVFTMRAPRLSGGSTNPVKIAEKQLKNQFSEYINEDTLKALITRITNGAVLDIKAEEHIPCSE